MINLPNFEIRKMELEGTWRTEDIDNEHLQIRVFSTTEKIHFSNSVRNVLSCFSRGQKKFQRKKTSLFSKNNFF